MSADWYCPKCERFVGPASVTFEETHDACGCPVVGESPYAKVAALEADCKRWEGAARHIEAQAAALEAEAAAERKAQRQLAKMVGRANAETEAAEAALEELRANRTDILDSAWNTANERSLAAEAELAEFKSHHTGGGCGCDATPE